MQRGEFLWRSCNLMWIISQEITCNFSTYIHPSIPLLPPNVEEEKCIIKLVRVLTWMVGELGEWSWEKLWDPGWEEKKREPRGNGFFPAESEMVIAYSIPFIFQPIHGCQEGWLEGSLVVFSRVKPHGENITFFPLRIKYHI